MSWARIITLAGEALLKVYEYELKITDLFQELLGTISFGNFILANSDDYQARAEYLKWYKFAIQAYGYYILLPCIFKTQMDTINRYPQLQAFFNEWPDACIIKSRIESEPEMAREDWEGIAKAFLDFFSPIVKGFMLITGTIFTFLRDLINSVGHALLNFLKAQNWNIVSFINYIIDGFRDQCYRMRTVNIPPEFYYQQRPTLDFDIAVLFAHIMSFQTYREILIRDMEQAKKSLALMHILGEVRVNEEKIKELDIKIQELIKFCIPKELTYGKKATLVELEIGKIGIPEEEEG